MIAEHEANKASMLKARLATMDELTVEVEMLRLKCGALMSADLPGSQHVDDDNTAHASGETGDGACEGGQGGVGGERGGAEEQGADWQLARLAQELKAAKQAMAEMEEESVVAMNERGQMQKRAREEQRKAKEEAAALQAQVDDARSACASREAALRELEEKQSALQVKHDVLLQSTQDLELQVQRDLAELGKAAEERQQLASRLAAAQAKVEEQEVVMDRLRSDEEAAASAVAELQQEMDALKEDKEQEVSQLREELKLLQDELILSAEGYEATMSGMLAGCLGPRVLRVWGQES